MGQRIRPMKFFEVGDNGLQNVPVCQPMSGVGAEYPAERACEVG
eukprot:CAMPEP_0168767342 /NCGR_PEP_ID=MMETSP0725-20121227/1309_1 /TAXON_ID=265536 /ORGANISM="Amphiprora sp., Strain CCMP467" /LENGTH=43 /DNA_ID= /DNA_START= /DNA_END= /DNA_ORIENTATION=